MVVFGRPYLRGPTNVIKMIATVKATERKDGSIWDIK